VAGGKALAGAFHDSFQTVASRLRGGDNSAMFGLLVNGVGTCSPGEYLTAGCFMKYTGLNDLLTIPQSFGALNVLVGAKQCEAAGDEFPPAAVDVALQGGGAMSLYNLGESLGQPKAYALKENNMGLAICFQQVLGDLIFCFQFLLAENQVQKG
jgi:hypothetical protein